MKTYLIDGNNLIGKIPELKKLKNNLAGERLIFILQRYFVNKKVNVTIFFDGYPSEKIKADFEIVYSLGRTADELIKKRIDKSARNKNLTVVSSDLEVYFYAKECGCTVIKSEEFYSNIISSTSEKSDEKPSQSNIEEFKKLFNAQ
jgi:predicted RNA-binding protein with PIN domain